MGSRFLQNDRVVFQLLFYSRQTVLTCFLKKYRPSRFAAGIAYRGCVHAALMIYIVHQQTGK